MAYVVTNPPRAQFQAITGPTVWYYISTDDAATVDASGYITNGGDLGLRVGDVMFVTDSNASPVITTLHQVSATGNGTTDLNDLTTITQTDSD